MSKPSRATYPTIDFGYPTDRTDPHHFTATIQRSAGPVIIAEYYGLSAPDGAADVVPRVELPRATWNALAPDAARVLNERLASKGHPAGRWKIGTTKIDRLLGKELCVLAWSVEFAPELAHVALKNWEGLKSEERWWLFTMTAAASGRDGDGDLGWRKALRYALTENPIR